jgi:hypothetical protein
MFVRGPGAIHADDGDAAYGDTVMGWSTVTGQGKDNDYRVHAKGNGSAKATWTFSAPPGQYKVLATWVASSSNAKDAPFEIFDNATLLKTTKVSQKNAPSSTQGSGSNRTTIPWADLGTVTANSGTLKVVLNDKAGGNVVADMVRLVPIQSTATASVVATRDSSAEASRERYTAIDQIIAGRNRREVKELDLDPDLLRDVLKQMRRAKRR